MINPALLAIAMKEEEARDRILTRLKEARAVDPGSALALNEADREAIDALLGEGLLIPDGRGGHYLNEQATDKKSEGLRFAMLLLLLAFGSIIASVAALLIAFGRH